MVQSHQDGPVSGSPVVRSRPRNARRRNARVLRAPKSCAPYWCRKVAGWFWISFYFLGSVLVHNPPKHDDDDDADARKGCNLIVQIFFWRYLPFGIFPVVIPWKNRPINPWRISNDQPFGWCPINKPSARITMVIRYQPWFWAYIAIFSHIFSEIFQHFPIFPICSHIFLCFPMFSYVFH